MFDQYTVDQFELNLIKRFPRAKAMIEQLKKDGELKNSKVLELKQKRTAPVENTAFAE